MENDAIKDIVAKYQEPSTSSQIKSKIVQLDKKVQQSFVIVALILGILGLLAFGSGMALYMANDLVPTVDKITVEAGYKYDIYYQVIEK